MTFLENIKQKNQFPIIFIGSGITKRYFKNAPDWQTLLLNIWEEVDTQDSFYKENYKLRKEYVKDTFKINTELASILSNKYNYAFYDQRVKLNNLSLRDAYENNIDPFKQSEVRPKSETLLGLTSKSLGYMISIDHSVS